MRDKSSVEQPEAGTSRAGECGFDRLAPEYQLIGKHAIERRTADAKLARAFQLVSAVEVEDEMNMPMDDRFEIESGRIRTERVSRQ